MAGPSQATLLPKRNANRLRGFIMKRLAVAMVLVLALSSAALALNYQNVGVTLQGTTEWTDGVHNGTAVHNNTFRINGSGDDWTANAEFIANAAGGAGGKNQSQNAAPFQLNDAYLKITGQPFQFEVWNWGEDGQGADYSTPLQWVFADNAPGSNWQARLTTDLGGNTTVFNVKNDATTPDYYLFTKRTVDANTYGAAYRTLFDGRNILDGWATIDTGAAKITGEVAKVDDLSYANKSKYNFGAKVEFPTGLILTAYKADAHVLGATNFAAAIDKTYLEANVQQLYRGSYAVENQNRVKTFDIRGRNGDTAPPIGDMFVADNDLFDINVVSENDWIKNTGWAAGLTNIKSDIANTTTNKFMATYAFEPNKVVAYARIIQVDGGANPGTTTALRGYWQVSDKLSVSPRVFINSDQAAGTAEETYDKDRLVIGAFVNYKTTLGQIAGGIFNASDAGGIGNVTNTRDLRIQAGYKFSL